MPSWTVDVLVTGAGIIGASAAWKLAQAGLSVALLDASRVGGEASWAGAGMLAPGGEIEQPSAWADFALESLALYPAWVEELRDSSGLPVDFRRSGAVEFAFSAEEWSALLRRRALQQALGIRSSVLSSGGIRERVPQAVAEAAGALFYPDDALVDPRDIMAALARCCRTLGVRICEQTPVLAIRCAGSCVTAETAAGEWNAGAAVLAAGAWSGGVPVSLDGLPRALPASWPVRGHLVAWRREPDSLRPILRHGHTYLLQRAGGLTIAGASSEEVGFDRALDPATVRALRERAAGLLPVLAASAPAGSWLGFRPAAGEAGPVVRRLEDSRLWLAYGHYRNGILLAPATARRVAREITASCRTGSTSNSGSV